MLRELVEPALLGPQDRRLPRAACLQPLVNDSPDGIGHLAHGAIVGPQSSRFPTTAYPLADLDGCE